ncbi:hypothetical protein [Gluconobacter sp. Dm-44]|uniref:hypothetical protein n=1 Tax=Gluconobacter sp. Dm-44 TaxID=2799805 RepID=UPI001B8C4A30|nr:hypothetical protein [Gluconobacter sp. Dm-44]MBS1061156.1 hypothetical protein [Gluconobacter sp. Dm-44]
MKAQRFAWIVMAVAFASIGFAGHAHASVTADQLSTPGYFSTAMLTAINGIESRINAILGSSYNITSSSTYTAWCYALLLGAWMIKLVENVAKTAVLNAPYADIISTLILGIIVQVLFSTYGGWTWTIVDAGQYLGLLVQKQAMGGDGLMEPASYIMKVWANFQFQDASIFSIGITSAVCNLMLLVFQVILSGAALFCCMWPTLVGGVAVLTGPVCFMFLFHDSLSFIFNGWLRMLFWAAFFGFISRICLVVICIVLSSAFGYSLGATPGGSIIALDSDNTLAFIMLGAMSIVALALLFFSGVLTSMLTGSANLDATKMIANGAKAAGTAALSIFL